MAEHTHGRVKEWFAALMEVPENLWDAKLLEIEDEKVREQLGRLLAANRSADHFLSCPAMLEHGGLVDEALYSDLEQALSGRFRITGLLGEGGMGRVYAAEQLEPVQRKVALKVSKLNLIDPGLIRRFERERQVLAEMNHPHICPVYEVGTSNRGYPWMAMALIEGQPLLSACDEARSSIADRLELFARVCRAVHHAHRVGVLHRDLKSSNLLVTEREGRLEPCIIDFGVVKPLALNLEEARWQTGSGEALGTPRHMSPEQFGSEPLDVRSDVYALGVTLFELLSGVSPMVNGDLESVLRFHQRGRVPAMVERRRASLAGEESEESARVRRTRANRLSRVLSGDLQRIVARAMAHDREDRYASAADLADDLERYLTGRELEAGRKDWSHRASRFLRRHVSLVAMSFLVLVALTWSTIASVSALRDSLLAGARRNAALIEAERELARAEAARDFMGELLTSARPSREGYDARVHQILDLLEAESAGAEPSKRPFLTLLVADTYARLGMDACAIERAERAREYALEIDDLEARDEANALLMRLGADVHVFDPGQNGFTGLSGIP